MLLFQSFVVIKCPSPQAVHNCFNLYPSLPFSLQPYFYVPSSSYNIAASSSRTRKFLPCLATSKKSSSKPNPEPCPNPKVSPKSRSHKKTQDSEKADEDGNKLYPATIPRKPRRGRKSEAMAVEDFVRNSLEQTFESIRQQNSGILENKENVLKEKVDDRVESDGSDNDEEEEDEEEEESETVAGRRKKKMLVEEEDPNWPLDADVGWGIRASQYFEQHPIKNIIGKDGVEIDWEGEIEDNWVKEINCLEWESFAFHPSPLIVLVFERYNRAADNWKTLKELEKALKVFWCAKDRLPPRSVKIDINIERDLAYALKVRECPQILFLRGNRILYREKEARTSDELVQMIAFFYYNARKPSWISDAAFARPF